MKIYQFIVKPNEFVSTVSANSMEDAMAHLQNQLKNERPHKVEFAGMCNADEYGKSLNLSTVLIEPAKIESLDSMAKMLSENGYKVEKTA